MTLVGDHVCLRCRDTAKQQATFKAFDEEMAKNGTEWRSAGRFWTAEHGGWTKPKPKH